MIDFYTPSVVAPVAERVAIMLEECGLAYTAHEVEVGGGAKKTPEFLKVNPRGTIPTLVDRSGPLPVTITQAGAILLYLAEKTGKFLPKEPDRRAVVYQWLMCVVTDAQPISMAAYIAETAIPEKVPGVVSYFEDSFVELCKVFDKRLAEAPWLGGTDISIADIALIPTIDYRWPLVEKAGDVAHLRRWTAEMGNRPAVRRILGKERPQPIGQRNASAQ
jgi:GST-like protein